MRNTEKSQGFGAASSEGRARRASVCAPPPGGRAARKGGATRLPSLEGREGVPRAASRTSSEELGPERGGLAGGGGGKAEAGGDDEGEGGGDS